MVKKKKKTVTKSATPVEKPVMGAAESQASVKEASSSPELAPPLSSTAMQTSDGVAAPSKAASVSNKVPAAGSSSKAAIAVINISDDSEDEDANVPLVGLTTNKGKQPARQTPSKPVMTSRTVESPSPDRPTASAKMAAPPSPSQSQQTPSYTPAAIVLSRIQAQQKLAEQEYPYITIYKLDLAEFTAKGIKVDETVLREHFGSHSPQAVSLFPSQYRSVIVLRLIFSAK
jgi:hypothetical protein